ncbi:MAG: tyrocidine synthetase, partial [Acidobacteriota bacterium]|nr:tyrocidine synthetase [Acidobacteriota bacterium]
MYRALSEKFFAGNQYNKERNYWLDKLSGELVKTGFLPDFVWGGTSAPKGASREMDALIFQFNPVLFQRLLEIINNSDSRLHMLLVTGLILLLYKYTGNLDIVIGTPIDKQETEGEFINTILPLRSHIDEQLSVKEFLKQVKEAVIEAVENQNYPIDTLPHELGITVNESGDFPLFDTALLLRNIQDKKYIEHLNLNIIFSFLRTEESLEGIVEYNTAAFERKTVERIVNHFLRVLHEAFFHVDLKLLDVTVLTEAEKKAAVYEFNNTTADYPQDKMIHQLFDEQVTRTPNNIAVQNASQQCQQLTYQQLNQKANQLAHLLKEKGIGNDTITAIMLESSIEVPLAIMAVLIAGGAYLPMGFEYPGERIDYILKNSRSKLLLTRKTLAEGKNITSPILFLDDEIIYNGNMENLEPLNNVESLVYIIYTSGTTGQPKGVMIKHQGLVNYTWWASHIYVNNEKLDFPLYTSISFDLTVTSIFTPLVTGNTIIIYGGVDKKLYIEEVIDDNRVGVVKLTPSHLKLIRFKTVTNSSIKRFIVGGEELETSLTRDIYHNFGGKIEIYNEYGPTETVVGSMIYKFDTGCDTRYSVPIGRPVANTQVYILNNHYQPVPIGVVGELYIGGSGLARGYLYNPGLTEEKFVPNPFIPGQKIYKTGDLAARLDDGNIEYKGRIDHQVKIRGHRVETGEIEAKIVDFQKTTRAGREQKENIVEKIDLKSLQYCKTCLIPANYPGGIKFDEQGICEICREFETYKDKALGYFKTIPDFHQVVARAQKTKKSKYDCLLLYSGGKDSSYTLHRLVDMGLKVLAFTFDNGYISAKAFENIDRTVKLLNVDHITLDSQAMKEIFVESLWSDYNVCNGCFKAVNTLGTKIAHDHQINLVISGLTRGQIFDIKLQGLFKLGVFEEETIEERLNLFRKNYHSMTHRTSRLIGVEITDETLDNTYFVDYFRYDSISTDVIFEYLKEKDRGWVRPTDTGASSSNCIINDIGIYVHLKDKGCHFYAPQLSWDCRLGTLTREEGLEEMWGYQVDYPMTRRVLDEIGYYSAFTGAVVTEVKDDRGEKVLCAYILADKELDIPELRNQLARELPDFMIPTYFTRIDRIPLTSSGKIDRNALPKPELTFKEEYAAPHNPVEEKLVDVWSELLGIKREKISIDVNFFEVGGHSLRATFLAASINKEFNVKIPLVKIFEAPTIRGLAQYVMEEAEEQTFISITPAELKDYYPLSSAQTRLYILQQMDLRSTAYNVNLAVQLKGDLDEKQLKNAFKELVRRHEILRTSFAMINGKPGQRIQPTSAMAFAVEHFEILSLNDDVIEDFFTSFIRPFDLTQAPLIRVGLVKFEPQAYLLIVDMHHIITDGISHSVLINDFIALYNGVQLSPLLLQYKDYSEWRQSGPVKNILHWQEEYWLSQYAGEIPVLNLPYDYPRPPVKSFEGNKVGFHLSPAETSALNGIGFSVGATLFMTLLAGCYIFLAKISNEEDIVVGTPISGRKHVDLQKTIGIFVNTLALRGHPSGEKNFHNFLCEIKEITLTAFSNQDYPFEDLVDKVSAEKDMSRNPLFDVMFILQNFFNPSGNNTPKEMGGIQVKPYGYANKTAKFDLTVWAVETGENLSFSFEYCTRLFQAETARKFIQYFKNVLTSIIEHPGRKIAEIDIMTEEEQRWILYDFNNTHDTFVEYMQAQTVQQLFMEQTGKTPDRIALTGSSIETLRAMSLQQITYHQLNKQSDRLAGLLMKKGIIPDTIVAIMIEGSVEMIISIMGILKSGAAYLPIDPEYPQERINYMLNDSRAKLLAVANGLQKEKVRRWEGEKVFLEEIYKSSKISCYPITFLPSCLLNPSNLVYVIYTSGSTGKPKGVLLEHRSLINLIRHQYRHTNIDFERVLQFASISFDVSAQEIFSTFLSGGQLYLVNKETRTDIPRLFGLIERNRIRTVFLPVSFLKMVFSEEEYIKLIPPCIAHIAAAGEQLIINNNFKKFLKKGKVYLHNHYGPTETHVVTTLTMDPDGDIAELPSIGKPVMNTKVYIVDRWRNLLPVGTAGELLIGGVQVGRGYLNRPELTKDRFELLMPLIKEKNKSFAGGKGELFQKLPLGIYRTGDLVRWVPDPMARGTYIIEFLGRIDQQVKIRGFRVEPGEIEKRLLNYPGVKEVVVVALGRESRDSYLCAYVVSEDEKVVTESREFLAKEFPDYLIPSYFVRLEKIPLTPNGKLDRKALPKPELKLVESYIAPRDEIEKKLAVLWSEVLGVTSIGIDDNFFRLGGHSLKATILISKIHKEFDASIPLSKIFITPTIRDLANYIKLSVKNKYVSIEPVEKKEYYALSSSQKRLYVLYQMGLRGIEYNLPFFAILEGEIDKNKFENTFGLLISRHESLRTTFHMINDDPVQKIHDEIGFAIDYKYSSTDYTNSTSDFVRYFDLAQAPLIRVALAKSGVEKHLLMVDMHHIIADGTSMDILVKDFMALYQGEGLPELRLQYKDFSGWQNNEKRGASLKQQGEYWLNEFAGEITVLELPIDYLRPAVQIFEGNRISFEIEKEAAVVLKALTLKTGATMYMVLLSLYTVFLSKVTNQEDIIIGSPIAGRRHADLENIIGIFVNTLALRNYPSREKKFTDFLAEVKGKVLKAFENQDYQYEDLVERVVIGRDTSRNPLFDTMFVLQNMEIADLNILDLKLSPYPYKNKTAKFDISLTAVEAKEKLFFNFEYSTKLFKEETIKRFIAYFKNIVNGVILDKDRKISDFEIIMEEEKKRILFEFNDTAAEYPKDKTIHQLFAEQVSVAPDRIALVGADSQICPITLSYNELNKQSSLLAGLLIEKGLLPDNIVGIIMERSVQMITGIMGILKAGGAYLPIDAEYPPERIDYMLKDSRVKLLVAFHNREDERVRRWEGETNFEIVFLDSFFSSFLQTSYLPNLPTSYPFSLAYIIYTSGSMGKPKGVMVEHRSLVNLCLWHNTFYSNTSRDRTTTYAGFGFDASVWEIFPYLIIGASLYIVPGQIMLDIPELNNYYERNHITIGFLPTQVCEQFMTLGNKSLRVLLTGGDKLKNFTKQNYRLYNNYGPTENTVVTTSFWVTEEAGNIPIGKPIANDQVYILNRDNHFQPANITGELCIGGEGLARGYLNRPELTAEKFIDFYHSSFILNGRPHRGLHQSKLYITGDLARWLPDGNIEFLGRIDQQVKIRGFRIELGEIESRLMKHPDIKEAVVLAQAEENGDKYLSAYIVSHNESVILGLREYLAKELPDYMIPSYFVQLEKIPLTPNGKLDRKALPGRDLQVGNGYIAPRNDIENKLVKLWAEILGRDASRVLQLQASIGIDDNFFQLGGHSLKATILVSKIHKEFDIKVPLMQIFKTPQIRELAKYIKEENKELHIAIEPAEDKEYYELSPAQKRLYILQQMIIDNTGYNMPIALPLEESIAKEKLESVFKQLIGRHESLRTSFITVNEIPVQRIHREVDFFIGSYSYEFGEEKDINSLILGFTKPFRLDMAPLLRVNLISMGISPRVRLFLFIDMHHIITDGTSQGILGKECRALLAGEVLQPLRLRLQYKDYSEWYNNILGPKGNVISQQEPYWLKEFSDEIPVLNLPVDYPRPSTQSFEGNTVRFSFNVEETSILRRIIKEYEITLYMGLLTIFNILLAKLSGQEDIIIGTPIAARRHSDLANVIGMLVNTLAMRNFPSGEKSLKEFFKELRTRTLDAYENQEYPFEVLVDKITVERDTSRNPVFDVMFNFLNQADYKENASKQPEQGPYRHIKGTSKFDMNLTAVEIEERIFFALEYSTCLFKPETIERIIGYYKNILNVLSRDTDLKIAEIEIMGEEEKKEILRLSSGVEWPSQDETIHGLFAEQVRRTPDNIALVGTCLFDHLLSNNNQTDVTYLTYSELDEQSNRVAYRLRQKGVGLESVVGLMVERSVEMIIGILGILKAGGAYLPINSEYPVERKKYMIEDGEVRWLLVNHDIEDIDEEIINRLEVIDLRKEEIGVKENVCPEYTGSGSNLVYVIYTSGSTGKPKGVMLEHRNLVNLFKYQFKYTNIDCSRILQFSTIGFDASFHEIFSVFLSGGRLYLVNKETRTDVLELFKLIERNEIKTVFLPISFLKVIFKEEEYIKNIPSGIRHIQTAGEQVVIGTNFKNYLKERKVYLHNHYGPSETHVVTTLTIDPIGDIAELPPIGRPVMNTVIYIVDKSGHLLPRGAAGEIQIGGLQIGRGYLNNPELTAKKFIDFHHSSFILNGRPHRGLHYSKLYRTGDLARWLPDGNIEFLGRIDFQVKIRGFRIELGEIENRLTKHPDIKEVVVLVQEESGDKYLCAYIFPNSELDISELRKYLAKELPDYMIPSFFIQLEKIPLTPNGKIDRKSLPRPELKVGEGYNAPRNKIEKELVEIWSDILGLDDLHMAQLKTSIGIDDNFFQLGGHSLKATILISKINKELNVKVPLVDIFKNPTIRELATYIKGMASDIYIFLEPAEEREYYALSSAQKRLYFLQHFDLNGVSYNMPMIIPLAKGIEKDKLELALRRLIDRHESLRTSFEKVNNEVVQRIHKSENIKFSFDYYEAGKIGVEEIIKNYIRSFDLSQAPLIRSGLIALPDENYFWMLDVHHIVADGTSQTILKEDFMAAYNDKELKPLHIQYKDFSQWQNQLFADGLIKKQEDYWLQMYMGDIIRLNLHSDYKRPGVFTFEGDHRTFKLESDYALKFKTLGARYGATLYMNMLAALNVLFYKYTGQTDIIIGSGIAGRQHADIQNVVGMFVNTLAMRNYPNAEKHYDEFLQEVIGCSIKAFENQDVQFEELVEKLNLERDSSRNPLFDISMLVQNFRQAKGRLSLKILNENYQGNLYKNKTTKFDLTFFITESEDDEIYITLEYYTAIFKKETIKRIMEHFKNVIQVVINNSSMALKDIDIISEKEKGLILYEFNDTDVEFPRNKTIHRLIEEQVARTPDYVSLIYKDQRISYQELDRQANLLAGYLINEKRVAIGEPVGVWMWQPVYRQVALIAILKAGGAFILLDPSLPADRIKYIISDACIGVIISEKHQLRDLNHFQWECPHFRSYLCIDSFDIDSEEEQEKNQYMSQELWHLVGERATDDITGGGWLSSFTGL